MNKLLNLFLGVFLVCAFSSCEKDESESKPKREPTCEARFVFHLNGNGQISNWSLEVADQLVEKGEVDYTDWGIERRVLTPAGELLKTISIYKTGNYVDSCLVEFENKNILLVGDMRSNEESSLTITTTHRFTDGLSTQEDYIVHTEPDVSPFSSIYYDYKEEPYEFAHDCTVSYTSIKDELGFFQIYAQRAFGREFLAYACPEYLFQSEHDDHVFPFSGKSFNYEMGEDNRIMLFEHTSHYHVLYSDDTSEVPYVRYKIEYVQGVE